MARGPGKGNTNNPNGKPKGAKNRRTLEWERLGDFITERGAERAMSILETLDDSDFLDQYHKLLSYFKPKLSSQQIKADVRQHDPIKVVIEDGGNKDK